MAPLKLTPPMEFDSTTQTIDNIAQKYLEQASKTVQHLIPIKTLDDGNCLFNCITSLMPNSNLSAIELRGLSIYFIANLNCDRIEIDYFIAVRTVVELVKNKSYYTNKYAYFTDRFDEVLRRACNNNQFCGLYELAALASVLQCEIQGVYPYIDYRAEMKNVNATYKPIQSSTPIRGRVIIFWTNTTDEVTTRANPNNAGVWSPNHFVPLVRCDANLNELNNNEAISILKVSSNACCETPALIFIFLDSTESNDKK
jgi:hypothetical protein